MAERDVNRSVDQVPAFDETLESVLLAALNDAKEKLVAGEEIVPFTALAVGETLFIETHPGDDVDFCFREAERTVAHAAGASAYAFCYDGYVETDEGERDVLIAEGGVPGDPEGYAVGYLYTAPGEGGGKGVTVDDDPVYIGLAPNFMALAGVLAGGEDEEEDGEEAGES